MTTKIEILKKLLRYRVSSLHWILVVSEFPKTDNSILKNLVTKKYFKHLNC